MNRRNITIIATIAVVFAIGSGFWLYNAVLGDTKPASGAITAMPLELGASMATAEPAATESTATEPATAAPAATEPTASERTSSDMIRFQIAQAESKASFTLNEVLNGNPVTVVGSTDQVAGEIAVVPTDLSTVKLGVITVNARTLVTDSERRDRAIKNFILNTDSYEMISFSPTAIMGLSGTGETGKPYSFQIAGDLTIRNKTMPVIFDITTTAESATRLSGTASATVNRADFDLNIPDVPMVANVSEQVQIAINFIAIAS
ncbi:MAG: YceI family protein [Oscillochloris sp.]|nr:YceI family protein [Oscillochloris sp.]